MLSAHAQVRFPAILQGFAKDFPSSLKTLGTVA